MNVLLATVSFLSVQTFTNLKGTRSSSNLLSGLTNPTTVSVLSGLNNPSVALCNTKHRSCFLRGERRWTVNPDVNEYE